MAASCVKQVNKDPYQEPPDVFRSLEETDYLERYEFLARIAAEEALHTINHGPDPSSWPVLQNKEGILAVVGSGIKSVCHFTSEAISLIKHADKVFYCVADPVTEIYIKTLSPDAKDLYVFYSNDKERYHTYVQMAEVLLHEVRKGFKVVAVYYGHPGVFVLPSHRAVQIARKQGLRAFLVPAVSALDCLVADVDFDPSFPGLQILEATDMLLRKRTILTDRHVVIWQVGCVGNPGYRRQGYLKEYFAVLLDYLQEFYCADQEIIHYIGSQFPTVTSVIQHIPLSQFRSPEISKQVTGISTFYIAPKDCVPYDNNIGQRMGLITQSTSTEGQPIRSRSFNTYETKEKQAIREMENFEVPKAFAFTPLTAASNYIEQLSLNPLKLQQHMKEPKKELSKHPEIPLRDTVLLASGVRGNVRAAAAPYAMSAAEKCAVRILTDSAFAHSYKEEMKKLRSDLDADKKLTQWLQLHGYNTNPADVQSALLTLQKTSLLPWTNQYTSEVGLLVIYGVAPPGTSTVTWNNIPINDYKMENTVLRWTAGNKNDSNGAITFNVQNSLQVAVGKIWAKDAQEPSANNFDGTTSDFRSPMQFWEGKYKTVVKLGSATTTGKELEVTFPIKTGKVTLGGKEITSFNFDKTTLSWSNGKITFYQQQKTASNPSIAKFYGKLWEESESKPTATNFWGALDELYLTPWGGVYKSYVDKSGAAELVVQPGTPIQPPSITYGTAVKDWQFDNPVISWTTASGNFTNAELTFLVYSDGTRGFSGKIWLDGSTKPTKPNTSGVIDKIYLTSWSTTYYTKTLKPGESSQTVNSDLLQIIGGKDMKSSSVILQGVEVQNWNFSGAKNLLSWTEKDNNSNASITFYCSKATKPEAPGLQFYGKYWKKGEREPSKTNWWGSFRAPDQTGGGGSSRGGNSNPFSAKSVGFAIAMGLLVFTIIEILRHGITYLAKKAYDKYKESQKEADEKDNDEVRARENQQDSQEQPDQGDVEPQPEPPPNDDAPPNNDAPPDDAPPNDAPPNDAPPNDAPPNDAPPNDAPPNDAPPNDAPPDDAPPNDVPPDDAPPDDIPVDDVPFDVVGFVP